MIIYEIMPFSTFEVEKGNVTEKGEGGLNEVWKTFSAVQLIRAQSKVEQNSSGQRLPFPSLQKQTTFKHQIFHFSCDFYLFSVKEKQNSTSLNFHNFSSSIESW